MKIAVIGGGAAGLMTTWLLDRAHEVHVFEQHPIPGGNVRTLGGNVECQKLEDGVISENGVSWFHKTTYPTMHRFLDTLGVSYTTKLLDSAIFLANGHQCHVSVLDCFRHFDLETLWLERGEFGEVVHEALKLFRQTHALTDQELNGVPLHTYISDLKPIVAQWARGIAVSCLSVPYSQVDQFPADMIIPGLREWLSDRHCSVVPGGVWSYMQKILDDVRATINTDAEVQSITRTGNGVEVSFRGGCETFDRVVIATTPECAFRLLSDPTFDEIRWFSKWRDHSYQTIAHYSESLYRERNVALRTPCDCFERPDGPTLGYNCCLNDLYEIDSDRQYSFGAHLDDWIEEDCVLDVQDQVTPTFHVDSTVTRHEIRECNGHNKTYYVGAYLIDGLHEGAVRTALEVSEKLGGRVF